MRIRDLLIISAAIVLPVAHTGHTQELAPPAEATDATASENEEEVLEESALSQVPQVASGLAGDTSASVAELAKRAWAGGDPRVSRDNPAALPFWSALQRTAGSVGALQKTVDEKAPQFFPRLDGLGSEVVQVNVAWRMLRPQDEEMSKAVKSLASLFQSLQREFGPETRRKAGDPTAAESSLVAQVQESARKIDLQSLLSAPVPNARLQAELDALRHDVIRVASAQVDSQETLLNLARETRTLLDRWRAIDGVIGIWTPGLRAEWVKTGGSVEEIDLSLKELVESWRTTDLSYLEEPVEVPDWLGAYDIEAMDDAYAAAERLLQDPLPMQSVRPLTPEELAEEAADPSAYSEMVWGETEEVSGDAAED